MPHAVAALLLAVAGVAKLRAPQAAARAVDVAPALIRGFAVGETVLAAVALISASPWSSVGMAVLYAGFAGLTLRLARAGAACGCFGAEQSPASPLQSALSVVLSGLAGLSAIGGAHTAAWIVGRPLGTLVVLLAGTAGVVYGIVLAYSELPPRWESWGAV
jgi:hypothetical protein